MLRATSYSLQKLRKLFGSRFRRPPPQVADATLITCQRNEGPFLIEWLAYHKAIGFKRIVVGANDCTDGSHEMLTRLAELGEVEYYPFSLQPDLTGAQGVFKQLIIDRGLLLKGNGSAGLISTSFSISILARAHSKTFAAQ